MSIKNTEESLIRYSKTPHHEECVCLAPDYSLSTRMLNTDYSSWIIDNIFKNDITTVEDFVWIIIKSVPPPGISERLFPKWEENIRNNVRHILEVNFSEFIKTNSEHVQNELKAALVLGYLRTNYDGFTLSLEVAKYITMMLLAHPIQFSSTSKLLSACKSFLNERIEWDKAMFGGDLSQSIWSKKMIQISNYNYSNEIIDYSLISHFQSILEKISLMSRVHLFSIAGFRKNKNILKPVNPNKIYHQIKYWGLDVERSTSNLVSKGLIGKSSNRNIVNQEANYEFGQKYIDEYKICSQIYSSNVMLIELVLSFGITLKRFGASSASINDIYPKGT